MQRYLKVVGSIAAAIILGAIGSGVWEKLLSPALAYFSGMTAAALSSLSSSYEDSIYQLAATDTTDLYPMKIAMLISVLVGVTLVITLSLRALARSNLHEGTLRRIHSYFSLQGLSFGLALVLMALVSMVRLDAASQVKSSSLRSLEILRPYIGEQVFLQLRSEYYSIESKKDFEAFKSAVLQRASMASKKLPIAKLPN